jgi:hypothetical protein
MKETPNQLEYLRLAAMWLGLNSDEREQLWAKGLRVKIKQAWDKLEPGERTLIPHKMQPNRIFKT